VSPIPGPQLFRFWPALASLLVLALLWSVQTVGFGPLATRYRTQLTAAGEIGASLDPRLASPPLPPRVLEFLRSNSVAAADADGLSQSGFLATDLVRRVSERAVGRGIDVAGSEPGVATQTPSTLEVRAHLKLRGRYAQFVELLGDLAGEHGLYRIERMTISPQLNGLTETELWIARVLLKREVPQ
jgi:hypothetical protein